MKNELIEISNDLYYDERSAGGLVYKIENNKVFWLLIKTISNFKSGKNKKKGKDGSVYKFPKGHLHKNEFLKQAALREVEEEARVKAKIVEKIGSNDYMIWNEVERKKITKKVSFFLMEYAGKSEMRHNDDEGVLGSYWLTFEAASKKLAYKSEKLLLERANRRLEQLIKMGKLEV